LDILVNEFSNSEFAIGQYNGHRHDDIPDSDKWLYFVQYAAGSEGWNCIVTNCIIFYSQSYSYKQTEQAMGRIDRLNTPYKNLYYYILKSRSGIDSAIRRCLNMKKDFNARNEKNMFSIGRMQR
jgi:superfamily II DNA or RNA helicase